MSLDVDGARRAIDTTIGAGLGLDADLAAFAIGEIVSENMASAARVHAIESGKDLGQRTMIAFGGAAPLHAARVARKLGVSRVMIPANAGMGSAIGFLDAGLAFEQARSLYMPLHAFEPDRVNDLLADMSHAARKLLGSPAADLKETRVAYMRYRGQGHEITVPAPPGQLDSDNRPGLGGGLRGPLHAIVWPDHSRSGARNPDLGRPRGAGRSPASRRRRRRGCGHRTAGGSRDGGF